MLAYLRKGETFAELAAAFGIGIGTAIAIAIPHRHRHRHRLKICHRDRGPAGGPGREAAPGAAGRPQSRARLVVIDGTLT